MIDPLFAGSGWRAILLDRTGDAERLAAFFATCGDYAEMTYGAPFGPEAAQEVFDDAPPGYPPGRKLCLGILDESKALCGLLEVLPGYPEPDAWFLGEALFAPQHRGRGLGAAVIAGFLDHARAAGARRVDLCVLDHNPRGRAFWERMGFTHHRDLPPVRMGARTNIRAEMRLVLGRPQP